MCIYPALQARLADAGAAWFGYALLTKCVWLRFARVHRPRPPLSERAVPGARMRRYDFTLDEAVAEGVEASEDSNAQLVYNSRGRLAVTMLRRLGGYRNFGTARHEGVRACSAAVLTTYLADLLDGATDQEAMTSSMTKLLKLINSASETPYLIWNHHTRAELLEFVEARDLRTSNLPLTFRGLPRPSAGLPLTFHGLPLSFH